MWTLRALSLSIQSFLASHVPELSFYVHQAIMEESTKGDSLSCLGSRVKETGYRTDHKDLCSPFNLLWITVPQQLPHLLPAALLVFRVPRQVVQGPGEPTGCGIMTCRINRNLCLWAASIPQAGQCLGSKVLRKAGERVDARNGEILGVPLKDASGTNRS